MNLRLKIIKKLLAEDMNLELLGSRFIS